MFAKVSNLFLFSLSFFVNKREIFDNFSPPQKHRPPQCWCKLNLFRGIIPIWILITRCFFLCGSSLLKFSNQVVEVMNVSYNNSTPIYVTLTSFEVFFTLDADDFEPTICRSQGVLPRSFVLLPLNRLDLLLRTISRSFRVAEKVFCSEKSIERFWKFTPIIVALRLRKKLDFP